MRENHRSGFVRFHRGAQAARAAVIKIRYKKNLAAPASDGRGAKSFRSGKGRGGSLKVEGFGDG